MPIWIATTPPGTLPAATMRMNNQLASSDAVPIAGIVRFDERADRRVVPLERRPQRQPDARRAPKHCTAACSDDRQRRADAEAHEVAVRDVRRVAAEAHGDEDQRRDEPEVLDGRRGGREREVAACVLGGDGRGDDAVQADLREHEEQQHPALGARVAAIAGPCTPKVSRCTMIGDARVTASATAAKPASTTPTIWRSSCGVCLDAAVVELGDEDRDDELGQQRAGHQVVREVRDRVRRLEDVGEERRAEDRAGDDDAQQSGDAAEERPARDAEALRRVVGQRAPLSSPTTSSGIASASGGIGVGERYPLGLTRSRFRRSSGVAAVVPGATSLTTGSGCRA